VAMLYLIQSRVREGSGGEVVGQAYKLFTNEKS